MKKGTLRRACAAFLVNHVFAGTRSFACKRRLLRAAGYEIGGGTKIVGPVICTGSLTLGSGCWAGRGLTVHGNGGVVIGDNCDIAPDVTFLTGGHGIGDARRRAGPGESYQITIGNGVWIGARATLCGNVTVGDGAVIAACACVTRDVPGGVLAGGVPARTIRELDDADTGSPEE